MYICRGVRVLGSSATPVPNHLACTCVVPVGAVLRRWVPHSRACACLFQRLTAQHSRWNGPAPLRIPKQTSIYVYMCILDSFGYVWICADMCMSRPMAGCEVRWVAGKL